MLIIQHAFKYGLLAYVVAVGATPVAATTYAVRASEALNHWSVWYIPVVSYIEPTLLGVGPDRVGKLVLPVERTKAECEAAATRNEDLRDIASGYACVRALLKD